jgi:multidrug efflux pump subunit AcrA (membrane-fusion protein)
MAVTSDNPVDLRPALARRVAQLARPAAAPEAYVSALLELQCGWVPALSGAMIRIDNPERPMLLGVAPRATTSPGPERWLRRAMKMARRVFESGVVQVRAIRERGESAVREHLVLIPVPGDSREIVAAYRVRATNERELEGVRERLEITAGLLPFHGLHLKVRSRDLVIERLRTAMELLEVINAEASFQAAATALCDEIDARWKGERVAIGFLQRREVRVAAMSHTEDFDTRHRLVQDIESTMEECLDQDTEVIHPRPEAAIYVSRAAERLSQQHGPVSVASLPLRRDGEVVGVLTLERPLDEPHPSRDVEVLRIVCELVTPRLLELRQRDRWVGARAASAVGGFCAGVIGPRHTWAKLIAIVAFTFLLLITLATGNDRIHASFEIAAIEERAMPAPFDGRLEEVLVEPGDAVVAGETVLARLETTELQMRLAAALAEHATYVKESDLAMRDGGTVEVQIAEANLERVEADIDLLEHRIGEATIVAAIGGTVVSSDLKRNVGAPVEQGDVLFGIAQLDGLWAVLEVPEDRIMDLLEAADAAGVRRGELASVAHPGDYLPFEVEHINPVAEVIGKKNVFRVKVRLLEDRPWLRPGMTGVAKLSVGRRSYLSLWTRPLVNKLRTWLWL